MSSPKPNNTSRPAAASAWTTPPEPHSWFQQVADLSPQHAAPRIRTAWPHQVGLIPPQARWFQDRAETHRLAAVLAQGGTAVVGSAGPVSAGRVLSGMGGVGKTQLAAHYARTAWRSGNLDEAFTPGETGRALGGRSSGAVGDACDKLTAGGHAALVRDKPRRLRAARPANAADVRRGRGYRPGVS
ncbi:hypothetical protein [Yinghuangia seranimata]|uniref:hypothetical protein n=1 Tax=Yinghuangia seranimata TaxID=408067 RepID=UPI00248AEEC2|nr:hypothetical protein [Yinghuangia seranimata]MDI2130557.1 hypothetical protein [Yinghuangia seranimata]